jgi:hypothetical protein
MFLRNVRSQTGYTVLHLRLREPSHVLTNCLHKYHDNRIGDKLLGLHGGDYEECRVLGYKNPVRTSQETHYVSITELSQLMLCKI